MKTEKMGSSSTQKNNVAHDSETLQKLFLPHELPRTII